VRRGKFKKVWNSSNSEPLSWADLIREGFKYELRPHGQSESRVQTGISRAA
jgi:hypothetical protein